MKLKQQKDIDFYSNQISYLENFISNIENILLVAEMDLNSRLQNVKSMLTTASSTDYIIRLVGTIGADPLYKK